MILSHLGGGTMFDITVPFLCNQVLRFRHDLRPQKGTVGSCVKCLIPQLGELSRGIIASSIDKLIADSHLGTGL